MLSPPKHPGNNILAQPVPEEAPAQHSIVYVPMRKLSRKMADDAVKTSLYGCTQIFRIQIFYPLHLPFLRGPENAVSAHRDAVVTAPLLQRVCGSVVFLSRDSLVAVPFGLILENGPVEVRLEEPGLFMNNPG